MASGVLSPTSMRDNVAKEILESEKTFVEQMQTLVKVFSKPLKWWAQELSVNYGKVGTVHDTAGHGDTPDFQYCMAYHVYRCTRREGLDWLT